MDKYINMTYRSVKPVKHSMTIIKSALTELKQEEENKVILRNGKLLNTVLEQVKFMIEDDVITWGLELKQILAELEEIYNISNITKLLK